MRRLSLDFVSDNAIKHSGTLHCACADFPWFGTVGMYVEHSTLFLMMLQCVLCAAVHMRWLSLWAWQVMCQQAPLIKSTTWSDPEQHCACVSSLRTILECLQTNYDNVHGWMKSLQRLALRIWKRTFFLKWRSTKYKYIYIYNTHIYIYIYYIYMYIQYINIYIYTIYIYIV
jgi:hypothetical protein